jgi:membrane protein
VRRFTGKTTFSIIAGSLTLYWCHYRFGEIQDSINMIWNLKAKPKRSWLKWITDRLLSSSLIAGLSFLLIVSW